MTVKNGRRWSTANAYLRPAMDRPNLTVITHTLVHKVLLEGKQAVGVRYERQAQVQVVRAGKEVILSAGSIGSPHLLQLSDTSCPGWAKTCRIIWSSISSFAASNPSHSTASWGRGASSR
ncbi:GMC family oxidoreductase N-terminal domain-containing protein [Oceanisphaera ostreae]|uniref:GMC family oxidoreductase N-terminal domain-containing protein n=1 Tax=Oceanisphaera ostreae TaxID=914151 RepID=A0ABW3KK08_9GAMM